MLDRDISEEYKSFIDKYGVISQDGIEIYGLIENMDESILPSVVAATKLYKNDYHLNDDELVICFDDYLNCPIIINKKNQIYNVFFDKREKIADSFNKWFEDIKKEYELDIN